MRNENDDLPLSWRAAWDRCTQSDDLQGSSTKCLLSAGDDDDDDDDAVNSPLAVSLDSL